MKTLKSLINNPWFSITGWIGTILGVLLTIYYYYRSNQNKRLVYKIETVEVITNKIKQIKSFHIFWENTEVSDLSISNIYLWNGGNKAIQPNDFPPLDNLRIHIEKGCTLYKIEIVKSTDSNSNFVLQQSNNNQILLNFDVIEPNEGLHIRIYHAMSNDHPLSVKGKIINFTSPKMIYINKPALIYLGLLIIGFSMLTLSTLFDPRITKFDFFMRFISYTATFLGSFSFARKAIKNPDVPKSFYK